MEFTHRNMPFCGIGAIFGMQNHKFRLIYGSAYPKLGFSLRPLLFSFASCKVKDQETRLLALMGKLECVIAIGRQEFEKGATDGERNYSNAKERYDVIIADLDSLRPAVGLEISFRLRHAFADMHANLRDFHERNRAQSGITQSS